MKPRVTVCRSFAYNPNPNPDRRMMGARKEQNDAVGRTQKICIRLIECHSDEQSQS